LQFHRRSPTFGYWAAVERHANEFIGWFQFRLGEAAGEAAGQAVELGYRLKRSSWGRGYATEGAGALVAKGFELLDAGTGNLRPGAEQSRAVPAPADRPASLSCSQIEHARGIFARAMTSNRASIRVMEKVGLRFERTYLEPEFPAGSQAAVIYSLAHPAAAEQPDPDLGRLTIRAAAPDDVSTYTDFARAAQSRLQFRGLAQYVPAAHDEYLTAVQAKAAAGTLYTLVDADEIVAFFNLESNPSPWWPADAAPALYLSGIVVAPQARGRRVGQVVVRWSAADARRRGCRFVRIDCHADNPWLCEYYEKHGFVSAGRLEQHPGYFGRIYQLAVAPPCDAHDA
jgi:RimJ/RimL family protein N-acetyltransferase